MATLTTLSLPEIIRMVPPDTSDDFREACPFCGAKIQTDKVSSHIAATHKNQPSSPDPNNPQRAASGKAPDVNDQPSRRSNSKSSPANKPQPIIQIKPRKKVVLTEG
jgi:hypothetical protein